MLKRPLIRFLGKNYELNTDAEATSHGHDRDRTAQPAAPPTRPAFWGMYVRGGGQLQRPRREGEGGDRKPAAAGDAVDS